MAETKFDGGGGCTPVKPRNAWLDLSRIILAVLVVCSHTLPKTNKLVIVGRIAVPMFFMIAGYFLYQADNEKQLLKAENFIKATLKYLLIGLAFSACFDFFVCCFSSSFTLSNWASQYLNFKHYLPEQLSTPSFNMFGANVLWFLCSMFLFSLIHYFVVKYHKTKFYLFIAPIGILLDLFIYNYTNDVVSKNSILRASTMIMLGYLLAKYQMKPFRWKSIYLVLGIIFAALQIVEAAQFQVLPQLFFCGILSAVFFILFLTNLPMAQSKRQIDWAIYIHDFSFFVYITHGKVAWFLRHYCCYAYGYQLLGMTILMDFTLCFVLLAAIKLTKNLTDKIKAKNLHSKLTTEN